MMNTVWDVTPYGLVEIYLRFGGTYFHYYQDWRVNDDIEKGKQTFYYLPDLLFKL